MRTRTLPTALAASLALGALAFSPVVSGEEAGSEEIVADAAAEEDTAPELFGPCAATEGATTITPEAGFDEVVPTPVGAINADAPTDAALLQVSLEGLPVGTTARVAFTLDWDTPLIGDYDLNINGANDLSVDQPERESGSAVHCSFFDVKTEVFLGTPVDTLTLTADVTTIAPPPAPTSEPTPTPTS